MLSHIARHSRGLQGPALVLALETVKQATLDVNLYESLFQSYRQLINTIESGECTSPRALEWYAGHKPTELVVDRDWLDKARRDAQLIGEKLEVELRGYTTNLIKESIRVSLPSPSARYSLPSELTFPTRAFPPQMGYRDLGEHQHRTGDLPAAIRSYTKCRDFCTTSGHVLEMCQAVIEVRAPRFATR